MLEWNFELEAKAVADTDVAFVVVYVQLQRIRK